MAVATIDAALDYAARGLAVFPVREDKRPFPGSRGYKDASADPEEVRRMFEGRPTSLVALALGTELFAVDTDTIQAHGGNVEGMDAWNDWCQDHDLDLAGTWTYRSATGGTTFVFSNPDHVAVRGAAGVLPNVDGRGAGNYVIVPPSARGGVAYRWTSSPADGEPLPIHRGHPLFDLLNGRASEDHFRLPERIRQGTRNDTVFRAACSLQARGEDDSDVLAGAISANGRCDPPLPDAEVRTIVQQAVSYPKGRQGVGRPTTNMVCEAIRSDVGLFAGIGHDEFSHADVKRGPLPWDPTAGQREWTDNDDASFRAEMQEMFPAVSDVRSMDALRIVMHERSFDSLADRLESLEWDGNPRMGNLLAASLGTECDGLNFEAERLMFREGVLRAFEPGAKCDHVIVLKGPGGCGKSTFCRRLALDEDLFTDAIPNLGDPKGTAEALRGKWIVELAELSAIRGRGKQLEAVKAAVTRQFDQYREPYARRTTSRPRRCVFIATSNDRAIITDMTGGARRFLPIECGTCEQVIPPWSHDFGHEAAQAWAEAVHEYKQARREGRPFVAELPPEYQEKAEERRRDFEQEDPRIGMVLAFLEGREITNTRELARDALGIADDQLGKDQQALWRFIVTLMDERSGWRRGRGRRDFPRDGRQTYWTRE